MLGYVGGSGTWAKRVPEDFDIPGVRLVERLPRLSTPFGLSAPFKIFEIDGEPVIKVAMHGCYPEGRGGEKIPPETSSKQVAWVFREFGVTHALVEASVGGICDKEGGDLPPWSIAILGSFFMPWKPKTESSQNRDLRYYRLGRPFCNALSNILAEEASKEVRFGKIVNDVTYACTPIGRFETPFEISTLKGFGAHVVGQTIAHEAKEFAGNFHYGALTIVSNFAECGIAGKWTGKGKTSMRDFYRECPLYVFPVIVNSFRALISNGIPACDCQDFELLGLDEFPVSGA